MRPGYSSDFENTEEYDVSKERLQPDFRKEGVVHHADMKLCWLQSFPHYFPQCSPLVFPPVPPPASARKTSS